MDTSWLTEETWITSDQHWSHVNIRKYQGRPENHFELMKERFIERVQPDDTVLCLGDMVCFPRDDLGGYTWLDDLPGQKYLLFGNHDEGAFKIYQDAGWTLLGRDPFWWAPEDKTICFSHEPMQKMDIYGHMRNDWDQWDMNIHGHIHGSPHNTTMPWLNYVNVCVEVTDYAPVRLKDVLSGQEGVRRMQWLDSEQTVR